ncbi:hypothetical protein [Thiohalomonas denitrificans]|uniref:nSTAND3 domain-containing NTPase n=1 Tax=Thiohalomonas denitrificans TaxID=415747 RepID=UPI0026F2C0E2|nr:hypothetical protein [Thiohalomonas denitrificans]
MSQQFDAHAQGAEVNYQLHSLGWKAFQNLCTTIMAEVFGQTVQTFFDSHDGGRDGAFRGTWKPKYGEALTGTFTAQCKFTAKADVQVKFGELTGELNKAKRLASRGLASNYILFTNARLTGTVEENIKEAFENIPGIDRFVAYGCERISQMIRESARLRMLVPRVYGLGDLSHIMDQRAYDQAQEILAAIGDDLRKFVITDAYRRSANALTEHGFVLLLGEPACGKSTIAATLALASLDKWGSSTVKVRNADDFVTHFNPHEKQFFWVDDAFGPTQLDVTSAVDWSRTFPHIRAAIHRGAKVLFTSRDYVYNSAKRFLKESALPVIQESKVVIHVQDISKAEREQILYNHVRLGSQPQSFKTRLKPFLPSVAAHRAFSPEIARRLGNPLFTRNLVVTDSGIDAFVARPLKLLAEVINTIDDGARSALALVFMRGGEVESPLQFSEDEEIAITRLGGTQSRVVESMNALNGSLLLNTVSSGTHKWRFKHPTVRDAFAAVIADNMELMDIYLAGAPLRTLLSEVSCGHIGIKGVKVIVPTNRYDAVIERLSEMNVGKWPEKTSLYRFLAYRCDKLFLTKFIAINPDFLGGLQMYSYLSVVPDVDVLLKLNELKLLPEINRVKAFARIRQLAVDTPDSDFLRDDFRNLITSDERKDILTHVRADLLPKLDECLDDWRSNFDPEEDDPGTYFDLLKSALQDYQREFRQDKDAALVISDALNGVESLIETLLSEMPEETDPRDYSAGGELPRENQAGLRSIFDDVDA